MDSESALREGMAVFDMTGRRVGRVEDLRDGHFFLTHVPLLPLVRERIVVDAAASVARVDADGVHLRADRHELLARQIRAPEEKSSRQVAPGADASGVRRGDEDRRPLDSDDVGQGQRSSGRTRTAVSPLQHG